MATARQTFANSAQHPITISVEPNPECYQLFPGDRLTIFYDAVEDVDSLEVDFIDEGLVIWPSDITADPGVLINGKSAEGMSWKFAVPLGRSAPSD